MSEQQGEGGGGAFTRRGFLAAAAVAAGGAGFAAGAVRAGAHAQGTARVAGAAAAGVPRTGALKIGVIGCGGRGTGAAVQALRADPDTVLWSMGDVFQDRLDSSMSNIARAMGEEGAARLQADESRRFTGFDSYQKVIDSGVDVVLLTSYPAFRPQHLRAAVDAGKHVFAEKPVAVDGPGVRSVIESARLAKGKNLSVVVGFCWRYNHGMREAFAQVNGGALGEVVTAHTTYLTGTLGKRPRQEGWNDLEFQMRNWWHFAWISGDHIVEQAVHSVDRLLWAMNDETPRRVICLGGRAARSGPEHGDVFDHFAATYEYEGGRRAFHTTRQIDACPNDNTDYIYGTRGSAVINGWVPTYQVKDLAGANVWRYRGDGGPDMYQAEHDELFAGIRAGTPINDCERGAHATLMAIMARMAAYTGQTISWEQAMESRQSLVPATFDEAPAVEVPVPGRTKFF